MQGYLIRFGFCSALAFFAVSSVQAQGAVKFGVILPYSGPLTDTATQMDGRIYIRKVEKVGGELTNIEFDKTENVKNPVKTRMPK